MKSNSFKWLVVLAALTLSVVAIFLSSNQATIQETLSPRVLKSFSCPENMKEECERLEQFEKTYTQLPEQPEFKKKDLLYPAQALALGYARLGNIKKAEHYYQSSLGIQGPSGTTHTGKDMEANRFARILEQYIYNQEYDDVLYHLKKEKVHKSLCSSAVQLFTYQKKNDLVEEVLKSTECSPWNISRAAYHLDKNEVIELYSRFNKLYQSSLVDNLYPSSQKTNRIKLWRNESINLLRYVAAKSRDNDDNPYIPESMEKDSLAYAPLRKQAADILISFYSSQNDLKALDLYKKYNTYRSYDLVKNPTETSFLIFIEINNKNAQLYNLVELLEAISKNAQLAAQTEFKYIGDICSQKTFKQCIFERIQIAYESAPKRDKIMVRSDNIELSYLKANALMSNYDYLREFERKNTDKKSAKSLSKALYLIADNRDCANYFQNDMAIAQSSIPDIAQYKGKNLYPAVQCLFTNEQYKQYIFDPDTSGNKWFMKAIGAKIGGKMGTSQQQLFESVRLLDQGVNKEIQKELILAAARFINVKSLALNETQKEKLYSRVDDFIFSEENYDPALLNRIHNFYSGTKQKERAKNLVKKLPKFQEYIKENFKSGLLINSHLRGEYKKSIKEDNLLNRAQDMSHEMLNEIYDQNEFTPHHPHPAWITTI